MLIRRGLVVSMVEGEAPRRADLRVSDGRIVEIAPHVAHAGRDEDELEAEGCFVLPGFVQAHVHLCQSLFRGAADDRELLEWLARRIWPLEAWLDEAAMRASARLGIFQLLAGGTTAILDMGSRRHTDVLFEEARDSGLRYTGGKCLMDEDRGGAMPAELLEGVDASMAECRRLGEAWHGAGAGRLRYALCPRFAVSCSDAMLRACAELAAERGYPIHTHASENRGEIELVRATSGRDNVVLLDELGILGPASVLAHCVHVDEHEIARLARTGTHVAHCPTSNLKLASGIAPIPRLVAAGVNVALGADGAACNNRLSAFREMLLAALIQKPVHGPRAMPAEDVLRMATVGGARALGLGDEIGTLEVGKRADVVVVDPRAADTAGLGDVASTLVYASGPEDVRHVLVDGRVVKRDGLMTGLDEDEILADAERQWARIRALLPALDRA